MSGLISKMKDKLHIGKDSDKEYKDYSTATTTAPGASHGTHATPQPSVATTTSAAPTGSHSHSHGHGQGATGTTAPTAGSGTGAGHQHVAVGGQQPTPKESVVIHEHDPNWQRARDLTTGAEQASKISAAKAYEAQSHLTSAHDAHQLAQDATNRHAELAAQAEAEKQNIGGADYVHRELDQYKNKMEEKEKIHIDMNKNLESTRNLVAAKEGELGSVAPVVQQHQKEIEGLTGKLNSLQGAKGELEDKHNAYSASLERLRGQHGQYAGEVEALQLEVERLNAHANELEEQARAARLSADEKLKALQAAQAAQAELAREADKAARGLQNVQKDLHGYKSREAELSQRLTAAQAAAQDAADLAAAKQAELQLARQQLSAEESKGQPVAQDIERYRREIHNKEREYEEAMTSSKAAREAYERFSAESERARKEALAHASTKDTKLASYQQLKTEAEDAKSREETLWLEAKKHGNTGDVNALQRLAEAEKNLSPTVGGLNQPIVTPNVGPKQPTTEGPKIHRSERATEENDSLSKEDVKTYR